MNAIKEVLMRAMEAYFKGDAKRIKHAHKVTEYAEELLKREGGRLFDCNWSVRAS